MNYAPESWQFLGGLSRFLWQLLTRFSKTVGCLAIIAAFVVAGSWYQESVPRIEAALYHESGLPAEQLRRVEELYLRTQQVAVEFHGASELPPEYASAAFTPKFPARFVTAANFDDALSQLSRIAEGKQLLKRSLTDRFEKFVREIQQTLRSHASSIAPPKASPPALPALPPPPMAGLYENEGQRSNNDARKEALDQASEVLATLKSAAEKPENQKKLDDAIAELTRLAALFPKPYVRPPVSTPVAVEPTAAEKVAQRLDDLRASVREAIQTSWALDAAHERALETVEQERKNFIEADLRVRQVRSKVHVAMAIAITCGCVVGLFFLLIGDWTQKASTEVVEYFPKLIPNFSASTDEVYQIIETAVKEREVPGLECTRELWHEGGAVSAKREYLRIARERQCFEICAAPFGTGFFVSYRATILPLIIDPLGILLLLFAIAAALGVLVQMLGLEWGAITLVFLLCTVAFVMRTAVARGLGDLDRVFVRTALLGPLYEFFLRPVTYYRIDSQEMYADAVRTAVSESFQGIFPDHNAEFAAGLVHPPVHPSFDRWNR